MNQYKAASQFIMLNENTTFNFESILRASINFRMISLSKHCRLFLKIIWDRRDVYINIDVAMAIEY